MDKIWFWQLIFVICLQLIFNSSTIYILFQFLFKFHSIFFQLNEKLNRNWRRTHLFLKRYQILTVDIVLLLKVDTYPTYPLKVTLFFRGGGIHKGRPHLTEEWSSENSRSSFMNASYSEKKASVLNTNYTKNCANFDILLGYQFFSIYYT